MEEKGWVYYRKVKRKGSAAGIFTGTDVFEPGMRHLDTAVHQDKAGEEDEDDGDDDGRREAADRVS
jgi:hypothetical protein